jgi:predicted ribosome quality control (RQC) complex YloA/Tae2 family protein
VNEATLEKIYAELSDHLKGQRFGKIFQILRFQIVVDFRLKDGRFLFFSIEPLCPRIYLIKRRLRDLEKQSGNPHPFILFLKKRISNAVLQSIEKVAGERILLFHLATRNELGESVKYLLVVQLTGRSANLLLLNEEKIVLDKWRETFGKGQEVGDVYAPPMREKNAERKDEEIFPVGNFRSLSESLDNFYLEKEAEELFRVKAKLAENKVGKEISKREKLIEKLNQDLVNHGDAEKWKRFGDLILANLAEAVRLEGKVLVVDYFDEKLPTLEIEIDEKDSLTEAAEKFFRRYAKSRHAEEEISRRIEILESEISGLRSQQQKVKQAIAEKNEDFLKDFLGDLFKSEQKTRRKEKPAENFSGARRFISSDGFEILVGKGAKDNDFLTFRLAKSLDLWLHAADYPGSHVIVRNQNRREIPPATLLEAAQIAAFYSQARNQPKVAVHYTPKKFVHKPKGLAPGLVSLTRFKTIFVEPLIKANKK